MRCRTPFRVLIFPATVSGLADFTAHAADRKPNIIHIVSDELGYYELSCLGNPHPLPGGNRKVAMPAMPRILLFALLWTASLPAAEPVNLDQGFRHVPDADRPWTYWWRLNGNVDERTIARDLEAMKATGFGGFLLFDARGYHDDLNTWGNRLIGDAALPEEKRIARSADQSGRPWSSLGQRHGGTVVADRQTRACLLARLPHRALVAPRLEGLFPLLQRAALASGA